MIKLRMTSAALSDDQMKEMVGTLFLGIFFATFWLTFAYGIFRLIRRTESIEPPAPKS
jgi:hypothetical protein